MTRGRKGNEFGRAVRYHKTTKVPPSIEFNEVLAAHVRHEQEGIDWSPYCEYCPKCGKVLHSNRNAFYCSDCGEIWQVRAAVKPK